MAIWEDVKKRYLDFRNQMLEDKDKVDMNENIRPEDHKLSESPIGRLFAKLKDTDISGGTESKLEGAKKVFNEVLQPLFDNTPVGRQIGLTPDERANRVVERYGPSVAPQKIIDKDTGQEREIEHPITQMARGSGFGSYLTENPLALMGMTKAPEGVPAKLWEKAGNPTYEEIEVAKAMGAGGNYDPQSHSINVLADGTDDVSSRIHEVTHAVFNKNPEIATKWKDVMKKVSISGDADEAMARSVTDYLAGRGVPDAIKNFLDNDLLKVMLPLLGIGAGAKTINKQ